MRTVRYDNQTVSQIEYLEFIIRNLNIEILVHGRTRLSSDWLHDDITSPFHRLYFILGGEGLVYNSKESLPLLPGGIYFIPAHSTWSYRCEDSMDQFFVHFKVTLMEGVDVFEDCSRALKLDWPENRIRTSISSLEQKDLSGIVNFKSLLFEIISNLIVISAVDMIPRIHQIQKYKELFQYINCNISGELKVTEIVEAMKKSHSALYKSLKADTGFSIKNYIDKKLLDTSREHLLLTDSSIKEIADQLGFRDQYYFSRFFRKHSGLPPSAYRSRNRM
ncbi:MAG: hypothetical protein DRP60_15175 [Spirochaetes bacterium]|nr:MAG: hypothetical protein DRP60_15175 [Spirochaetota bacterium]